MNRPAEYLFKILAKELYDLEEKMGCSPIRYGNIAGK
jgi:hypothetical protein